MENIISEIMDRKAWILILYIINDSLKNTHIEKNNEYKTIGKNEFSIDNNNLKVFEKIY